MTNYVHGKLLFLEKRHWFPLVFSPKSFPLLSTVLFFLLCCGNNSKQPSILAEVGKTQISGQDVAYRIEVQRAYGDKTITEPVALVSLINDALEQEAGRLNEVVVTVEELKSMSEHVDKKTQAPKVLAAVKGVFGQDLDSYKRLYLSPKIINRKLRYWFNRNPEIHKPQREQIEKAYGLVVRNNSFENAAEECGLIFSVHEYGGKDKDKTMPAALKPYFSENEIKAANEPFMKILNSLSFGEIFTDIVENDSAYQVIKLLEKTNSVYKVESIIADKYPFDKWFREQASKVKIKILDKLLEKKITLKYPKLWWLGAVTGTGY